MNEHRVRRCGSCLIADVADGVLCLLLSATSRGRIFTAQTGEAGDGGKAMSSPHRHDPDQRRPQFVEERQDPPTSGRFEGLAAVARTSLADQRFVLNHCRIAADLQDYGSNLAFADSPGSLARE